MSHPPPPSLHKPPELGSLYDLSGLFLACSLLPVWIWGYQLPWTHRKTAIMLGMQAAHLEVYLSQGSAVKSLSVKWKQRRWTERDNANEFRITCGLVSTGILFSGPRGLRWSETGRVWANLKGLYTFLMSFDFKNHRKPGKVLVGCYYVPTIIFWIHLPSHRKSSRVLGREGDRDFDCCQIMYPLFILAVVPNIVYFHLILKTLSGENCSQFRDMWLPLIQSCQVTEAGHLATCLL